MATALEFNFSQFFKGIVWGTLAIPQRDLLILETRDETSREVRFSALDYNKNEFLWRDIAFKETWWIGLTAATPGVLLFHHYHSMENPDDKGLIAFDIVQQKILWQYDHFSFACLGDDKVWGYLTKQDMKQVVIDLYAGQILEDMSTLPQPGENISFNTPFQYSEGQAHFETVKSFLYRRINVKPVAGAEYLEHNTLIFVSYYIQEDSLANYLVVLTADGEIVWHEKISERLKGLGMETFFILSGCLFFVRNKCELVSYRII